MTCEGRTVDQYRTVWHCELDAGHPGDLCESSGMLWRTPGRTTPTHRLRVKPVEFFQWTGSDVADAPDWLNASGINPDFDSLTVHVSDVRGLRVVRHLLLGDWAIRWSDGVVDVRARDRFEAMFEAAP